MYGGVHIKGTPWLELTRLLLFVLSLLKPPWCHIIVLYLLSYLMQIMFELRRGLIVVRVLYWRVAWTGSGRAVVPQVSVVYSYSYSRSELP